MSHISDPPGTSYRLFGRSWICAYCGQPGDNVEHTVPRWYVEGNQRLTDKYWFVKVFSCLECNLMAGKTIDGTFIGRRRRVAKVFRKKYRKLLGTADWEADELKQLGYNLRTYCSKSNLEAAKLRLRLRTLDSPIPPDDVPNELFNEKNPNSPPAVRLRRPRQTPEAAIATNVLQAVPSVMRAISDAPALPPIWAWKQQPLPFDNQDALSHGA